MPWQLHRALDPDADEPLFLQLVRAVAADIAAGRLPTGVRLPSSRSLAGSLGVNRNTVLAAYQELAAEGLIVTRPAGGTFVAPPPLVAAPVAHRPPARAGFPLPPHPVDLVPRDPPGALVLARAAPDPRLLPTAELARAYRRVLLRHGRALLFYGDPQGEPRLRAALAAMLSSTRALPAGADNVLVTRGSQMALDLCARALLGPGDTVAVEELGNPVVWSAFRLARLDLVPLPVDEGGLVVSALETLAASRRVRAVYITPHHQFPTTSVMPAARRRGLLEVARRHGLIVLEDDYDHEFHYDARPVLPVASADDSGVVVYIGTLSKILAPGLRLGFVVAPREVIAHLTSVRRALDIQGDHATEQAIAELFEDGEILRHVHRMRQAYASRRDALADALRRELGSVLSFEVPTGGMALWARVAPDVDLAAWGTRAGELGVSFRGGAVYDFKGQPRHNARLAFTYHDEAELAEAARRLARALPAVSAGRSRRDAS